VINKPGWLIQPKVIYFQVKPGPCQGLKPVEQKGCCDFALFFLSSSMGRLTVGHPGQQPVFLLMAHNRKAAISNVGG